MEITFATARLAKLCNDPSRAVREWGPAVGVRTVELLVLLAEAPDLATAAAIKGLRIHRMLGGKRKLAGQVTADITSRMRLVFLPICAPDAVRPDGSPEWSQVTTIEIIGVEDTHND